MLSRLFKLPWLGVVVVFLLAAGMLGGFAMAQTEGDQYTGCLAANGNLNKVAVGDQPATPCKPNQTQITWNAKGEQGDPGPAGPQGPPGPATDFEQRFGFEWACGGCDLSGFNAAGQDLTNTWLRRAFFGGADLTNANMSNMDLDGANFDGANLINTNMSDSFLVGASFRSVEMDGADLSGSTLGEPTTLGNLGQIFFDGNAVGANFSTAQSVLSEVNFNMDATGANFDGFVGILNFTNSVGVNATFVGADLSFITLPPGGPFPNLEVASRFNDADLSGADFTDALLEKANFGRANLTGADLQTADLTDTVWFDTTCPDGSNSDDADSDGSTCISNLTPLIP